MREGAADAQHIGDLLERLTDPTWSRRADALREATALLASNGLESADEDQLGPVVVDATTDAKWEVRKAAALALAEFRHFSNDVLQQALAALLEDSNRWVSQAATRASRRLRSRPDRASEWPLTASPQDPTLQLIVTRIREVGLQSMTPARIFDLATEVGERYYQDLAADTAHEIKTLLTPLEGHLIELDRHLAGRAADDAIERDHVAKALGRLRMLATLVDDLRTYSSPDDSAFRRVDLGSVVREAVGLGCERRPGGLPPVGVRIEVPDGIVIDGNQQRLVRAIANIVANAQQAMPEGGALTVRARSMAAEFAEVTIADTGRGMTAEQIDHAMERFRSTRRDEGGTGLGLPIAEHIIVNDHGGELAIDSVPGEGTKVVIMLPLRHAPREGEP